MALTPDEQLSIKLFLADTDGSENIYNEVREAILEWHPEDKILTHHCVKRKVAEISGITPILEDMCPNSCISYTGPFKDLDICPYCHKHCYDPILLASRGDKKPRQQFNTFPVGPQIQAQFRSPESVADMQHQKQIMADVLAELQLSGKLDIIEDIPHGSDFWDAYQHGQIAPDDLYEHKTSNCWIYIWILHYKKKYIMPGAIVPDSLLFPGLHHVTALQNEGLAIWDASQDVTFKSHPWIFLAEADAIGAPELTGYGCRNRCGRKGRRKPGGSHYYAVEHGCDDDDYEPSDLPTASPAQYKQDLLSIQALTSTSNYEARRLETGLSKSSIFCGLAPSCTLPVPLLFPGDIMHLFGINIPDLLQKLWRGLMECDTKNEDSKDTWDWICLVGDVWKQHGEQVAAAKQFLPSSFDRPPRNPAEKISSGYKCWEFLHWLYGLAPALLHGKLSDKYWWNFCKLCHSDAIQHAKAHQLLSDFDYEFEELYIQRKVSRMHFSPQCMHAGAEIRQPSKPFANLAQRTLCQAQVNSLKAMLPDLDPGNKTGTSRNTHIRDLGNGYVLLHSRED
ncbi:hypothetical protein BKA93DRAFT_816991 [Sparassis latifolia]